MDARSVLLPGLDGAWARGPGGWRALTRTPLDLLNLFVAFPGDMLFFVLVIAFSQGSLFLAFGHRSRFPFEHSTRRYVFAAAALVMVWLIMLGAALIALFANLNPNAFMPPLERLAYSVTLLLVAWAFLSADFALWRNRSNLIVFGIAFVAVLLYLNTARAWLALDPDALGFNETDFALVWSAVPVCIGAAALALALLNIRHILDAPLKSLFFLLIILGNGWDIYQLSQAPGAGHYMGGARLAYVGGMLLLPLIIYRLAVALLENSLVEVVLAASQPSSALAPAGTPDEAAENDPVLAAPASWNFAASPAQTDTRQVFNAIGIMLDAREHANLPEQIVKATLDSSHAEISVLLRLQDDKYADVIAGYDQIAEQALTDISLNLSAQPTLLDAIKRGEQTILFPDYHAEELADLFRRLNVSSISSVAAQPLMAEGEPLALLLASMPYRQAELSPEALECLRDIGFVAGNILAFGDALVESSLLAKERALDEIAAAPSDTAFDLEAIGKNRREMETSLESVSERMARADLQIIELQQQLQQQHIRLLDALAEGDNGESALQRLNASFDEQAQLREDCHQGARELLDAETILRISNDASGDTLAQIIREYLHKELNLRLTTRDRLRQQINGLLVSGRSAGAQQLEAVLQSVSDESAQLELEREQQQRRLSSLLSQLASQGVETSFSSMTKVLLQLYAERTTSARLLSAAHEERASLVSERERLLAAGASDSPELERQLKRLQADHEQLLNAREEMRREHQALHLRMESSEADQVKLRTRYEEAQAELAEQLEGQEAVQLQIDGLIEERDNLLKIRDQLAARVTASFADGAGAPAAADVNEEMAKLEATVQRLIEQREVLALELSDARAALSRPRAAEEASPGDAPQDSQTRRADLVAAMLQDMRAPIKSIKDYTEVLLAESIGILGAAQLQVLRMISADIGQLTAMISDLQDAAALELASGTGTDSDADLTAIIEDIIQERSQQLTDRGLLIELALGDHLPPVGADGASLKQVLTQLIVNASRVSAPGDQITISADAGPLRMPNASEAIEAVEIRVRDQGGGIASADIPRVFARKYRRDNPEIPGFGETGVGMTIARAFARAHDGDLWITSEMGAGSEFHLALPMQLAVSIED